MNPYVPVTQLEQVTHGQSFHFGPFGSSSMKPLHFHRSLTPWLSQQGAKLGLPEALCRPGPGLFLSRCCLQTPQFLKLGLSP